ncbi:hypothetical protein Ac2012v2_8385 [Leucoagaricus gongylophorus]
MCPGVSNAMDLITPSITGRRHSAAKKTISQTLQGLLQRKTTILVLIGVTVSTKSGMVENNRNSMKVEYSCSDPVIFRCSFHFISLLFFFFSIYMLFAFKCT